MKNSNSELRTYDASHCPVINDCSMRACLQVSQWVMAVKRLVQQQQLANKEQEIIEENRQAGDSGDTCTAQGDVGDSSTVQGADAGAVDRVEANQDITQESSSVSECSGGTQESPGQSDETEGVDKEANPGTAPLSTQDCDTAAEQGNS